MATKFAVIDEEADIPASSPEPKQPHDWQDAMDKIVTILVLIAVAGGIGYGSYWAGGYFNQPTFTVARAEIEGVAGSDVADEFAEMSKACRDDIALKNACRLLFMDGRTPQPKLASAKVTVPHD